MKKASKWREKRNTYADRVYEEDDDGYILGAVLVEGTRWGWGVSNHAEGRDEPAMLGQGQMNTKEQAMQAADSCYYKYIDKRADRANNPRPKAAKKLRGGK